MAKNPIYLTVAQFARLHEVNKRTLHYYDQIGIFSPSKKGENGYRYYDSSQSIGFEYIRMLKDLNMSMEELGAFISSPDMETFIQIAEEKEKEKEEKYCSGSGSSRCNFPAGSSNDEPCSYACCSSSGSCSS